MNRDLNNEIWGKTLLSVYRYLETLSNSIDNLIKKIGVSSAFCNRVHNSAYTESNKIIELTERKIKIINLKVIIEDALNKLKETDLKIIALYYIDALNYKTIMEALNLSQRTFFRRKEMAISRFATELKNLGYDSEKLLSYLNQENWIINTYRQVLNNTSNLVNVKQNKKEQCKMLKMVLNDFTLPNFDKNYLFS